jgi:hypothetical protein
VTPRDGRPATAAVAAQEIYPRLGRGPIARSALARVDGVAGAKNPVLRWIVPRVLPLLLSSGLFPRMQRWLFLGAPLPPLDPAFSFRA